MPAHESTEFQEMEYLLRRAAELEEILHRERDSLITEKFGEYQDLLTTKEMLIQSLFEFIEDIYPRFSDEDKNTVEDELRRLQQINRGNMFLLHSYKLFHENVAHIMGLETEGEEGNPYQRMNKGSRERQNLMDGQA